ncbi:MAG: FAD-dependent oxidoreductase [Acidobacteria bacterium]|nr:FAD-dependent oxidoreductase [Acidobacteriota bacterium]
MSERPPARTWRLLGLELALDEPEERLRDRAAELLGVDAAEVRGFRIAHKALDMRRRGGERRLRFVCHVDVVVDDGQRGGALSRAEKAGRARLAPVPGSIEVKGLRRGDSQHAVVVGGGPAGLFAALALARNGVRVTVLERGPAVIERSRAVARFHRSRVVDPERNLLFGEGGAGTYSDGKIYTRVDDPLEVPLLEELIACGAPPAIAYDSLAHIGTDRLHRILPAFRQRLEALGVVFRFETRLESLVHADGQVRAVHCTAGEIGCDAVVLAVGHSARDTWTRLAAQGVPFEAKPFQLGLRIEHPQELIDRGRYGAAAPELGAASYNLVCRAGDGLPAAYSFCMCPGGRIVAAVNEPGLLCTNGMSNSTHSSPWASAAVVTTLGPREFGGGAFDGVAFQRALEQRFFDAGGGDYTAPAQTAADFIAGRQHPARVAMRRSTWPFGVVPGRLDLLLPEPATRALVRALRAFDNRLPGFASDAGLLVGLESRSSGPVRIPRDRVTRVAAGFMNLYPVGEGAGYAGGIMSAALDGANAALALIKSD